MTREEANKIEDMIQRLKSYSYATRCEKGEPVLNRFDIGMLQIFIEGLVED